MALLCALHVHVAKEGRTLLLLSWRIEVESIEEVLLLRRHLLLLWTLLGEGKGLCLLSRREVEGLLLLLLNGELERHLCWLLALGHWLHERRLLRRLCNCAWCLAEHVEQVLACVICRSAAVHEVKAWGCNRLWCIHIN